MLRKLAIKCLAPVRWAIRAELQRHDALKLRDVEAELQRRALIETSDYVEKNLANVNSVDNPLKVLTVGFQELKFNSGLFLEFGVFSGRTINHIATLTNQTVFGFDSFEGLPERWRDGLDAGHFKVNALPIVHKNVVLLKGWFDQTLPEFLKKNTEEVAFLHVDCDLYSSTKTIFDCLTGRIKPGTVIVFDEYFNYPGWKNGEYKAFQEFLAKTGLGYKYVSYFRNGEQVCVQIVEKQ